MKFLIVHNKLLDKPHEELVYEIEHIKCEMEMLLLLAPFFCHRQCNNIEAINGFILYFVILYLLNMELKII